MSLVKLMKNKKIAGFGLLLLMGFTAPAPMQKQQQHVAKQQAKQVKGLEGAWRLSNGSGTTANGTTAMKLVQDGFFTVAVYDQKDKKFLGTYGGTYTTSKGKLTAVYEFNTFDSTLVGKSAMVNHSLQNGKWQLTGLGSDTKGAETWERVNEGTASSPLTGTWRIIGRERDGQMSTMQAGPRKTLKVLTGTRFQWIAFNPKTGEFSGTGGGTYTANDGKYTEHIEFFSRDSSRVGMQLSFNYEVKDGKWHHTGKSSTGAPVNEVWERYTQQ